MKSTKTLVKKAKKGDGEAFVTLVKQYEDVLYNTAIRMLQTEEDAADAIQDAIIQAYEKIHTLRNDAYFNTWLYKILLNQCNRILNKNKNLVEFDAHLHAGSEENMSRNYAAQGYHLKEDEGKTTVYVNFPISAFHNAENLRLVIENLGEVDLRKE